MNIEQIERAEIVGNAFHDANLLDQIGRFVLGDYPMEEKRRALFKLDQVLGEERGTWEDITEEDVWFFINDVLFACQCKDAS